ncbi:MAG: DUF58 domain-containing protein [Solirubrobacteraceae bacterium]
MSRTRRLAASGALLCALAALFAVRALYVPGLAALLVAAVAPVWVLLAAKRARVSLHADVSTAQEGEKVRVTIAVRRGLIPFPAAALTPWPGAAEQAPPSRRERELVVAAVASRRGRQSIGPARLQLFDPLEMCSRELRSSAHELLVLPRVYPLGSAALARLDERAPSPLDAALEIDSLRPYRAGGSAARIHWPTVARSGELMERGFTAETDARVLVVLDARAPESEEALDQALRVTASLCVHLARRGGCLLSLPGDPRPSPIEPDLRAWPALHARLALVRPGTGAMRRRLRSNAPTLLYVTASDDAPAPDGPCYRLGPRPLTGLDVAFTVAGFAGQVIDRAPARAA